MQPTSTHRAAEVASVCNADSRDARAVLQRLAWARRWAPIIGVTVWLVWAASLTAALRWQGASAHPLAAGLLFLWMTWLYCGLFITAHDACHQSAAPGRPRLNHALGRLCALSYAGFDFAHLRRQHGLHHVHGGTARDPDFCAGTDAHARFWPWVVRFFRHYVTLRQLGTMTLVSQLLLRGAGLPPWNVYAFWALPSALSALQLFVFGTYLPHRPRAGALFADAHRARSQTWPLWLSLLTCFFFGYHHVHHVEPKIPWYCLPAGHRAMRTGGAARTTRAKP